MVCRMGCGRVLEAVSAETHEESCLGGAQEESKEEEADSHKVIELVREASDITLWCCWKCGKAQGLEESCAKCKTNFAEYQGDLEQIMTTAKKLKAESMF